MRRELLDPHLARAQVLAHDGAQALGIAHALREGAQIGQQMRQRQARAPGAAGQRKSAQAQQALRDAVHPARLELLRVAVLLPGLVLQQVETVIEDVEKSRQHLGARRLAGDVIEEVIGQRRLHAIQAAEGDAHLPPGRLPGRQLAAWRGHAVAADLGPGEAQRGLGQHAQRLLRGQGVQAQMLAVRKPLLDQAQ